MDGVDDRGHEWQRGDAARVTARLGALGGYDVHAGDYGASSGVDSAHLAQHECSDIVSGFDKRGWVRGTSER